MTDARTGTFAALVTFPNYRRYVAGQTVSLAGTWMHSVALGWLVLQLTGSGTRLGLVTAAQFVPVLAFGASGGVIVDRFDTRRLLLVTQGVSAVLAGTLGMLVVTHNVRLWMVYAIAVGFGIATVVDNPARQTFVNELVAPAHIANAVMLNTVNINAGRIIGPAFAALVIDHLGIGACFLLNGASFLAIMLALALIEPAHLFPAPVRRREKGQLRAGFAYVRRTPELLVPLVMMTVIGTLTYEFQVNLPLLARFSFHGGASTYSLFTASMGVGAVVGGLLMAGRDRRGTSVIVQQAALFGAVIVLAAAAPRQWMVVGALLFVGAFSVTFIARANATMQLQADPAMRGRVMALWTVAFLGTTPVGGPIIGAISEHTSPRWGLLTQGAAALAAAAFGAGWLLRSRRRDQLGAVAAGTPPAS
jgi:MFS family permease